MALVTGSALVISFCSQGLAAADSQTIYLTIVSRCDPSVVVGEALARREGPSPTDIRVPLMRIAPFFYTGHIKVSPGRYDVGARIQSRCFGAAEVTVLPAHDRDVNIEVGAEGAVWDAHAFLYGTLPFKGFAGGTLAGNFGEKAIEIDGQAYYAEHVSPGGYVLELSYNGDLECRIPVVITSSYEGQRLDISIERMQQCIGYPFHYPGTGGSGFTHLYPTSTPGLKPSRD